MYSEHTNCSYTHMLQSALFQCIRVATVQEREYDATAVNPALVVPQTSYVSVCNMQIWRVLPCVCHWSPCLISQLPTCHNSLTSAPVTVWTNATPS